MRLHSAKITNYKCIDDSGTFTLRALTCLAGKNEAGKTAILQALYRLNPVEAGETNFDYLTEYPRRRLRMDSDAAKTANVVTAVWQLEEDDVEELSQVIGVGALTEVTSTKGYANRLEWKYDLDEKAVIEHLIRRSSLLTPAARDRAASHCSLESLRAGLDRRGTARTKGEQELLEHIDSLDPRPKIDAILSRRLPNLLYFPTYSTLPGRVRVDHFRSSPDRDHYHRVFGALLDLAETDAHELQDARKHEALVANLEGISNHLTSEIFRYWSQNKNLLVDFSFGEGKPDDEPPFNEGPVFRIRIKNLTHGVSVAFDDRSTGFVWFFSFLVWFSQTEKRHGESMVILLDEPGLSLHGKAQADLLRYIKEGLIPTHQVLYTTHSPFMIDTDNILSVRTVEDVTSDDGTVIGTKVGERTLSTDADTLFPLRAALGYDITQSLFVGEHCLLVEGPSDLLYLHWVSRKLKAADREALEPKWTVTPVGGIDKCGTFVALFGGNRLHVAVLTDYHHGDKRKVRELRTSELLRDGHVFLVTDFTGQQEADVEDMLGRQFYMGIVNACYGLSGQKILTDSGTVQSKGRILAEVEQHFRTVVTTGPEFDHFSPAVYLTEHDGDFAGVPGLDECLDRFEEFFSAVNNLL